MTTQPQRIIALSALFALLSGCVALDPSQIPGGTIADSPQAKGFEPLDADANKVETTHFVIRGYSVLPLQDLGTTAESVYDRFVRDTGIKDLLTNDRYAIVVYRDQREYLKKTSQPAWSRAVSVGSTIYTYEGYDLKSSLAHEISHVVFNSYMGTSATDLRWLNEGLAVYEEMLAASDSEKYMFESRAKESLRREVMTFTRMSLFTPSSEEDRLSTPWFQQSYSVVAYLIRTGSPIAMAGLLQDLRNRVAFDQALTKNYAGKFSSMGELETSWKSSL